MGLCPVQPVPCTARALHSLCPCTACHSHQPPITHQARFLAFPRFRVLTVRLAPPDTVPHRSVPSRQEGVLAEVRSRLWALLRPLMLHRRARDVDLVTMRAATTNLNLYDHFSAARADGSGALS